MHKSDPSNTTTTPTRGYERRCAIRTELKEKIDELKTKYPGDLDLISDVLEGQRVDVVQSHEAQKREHHAQLRRVQEAEAKKNGSQPAPAK